MRIGGEDAHRIGVWSDFATGESGGDLLDLWCAVRKVGLSKAIQEASAWLGVRLDGESSRPKRSWSIPAKPSCSKLSPESPQFQWLESRHLSQNTIAAYKIGLTSSGELVFPYLKPDGSFVNAKYRRLPKTFRQEAGAEPCLFGWKVVETCYPHSRWCVLVEGELDAMSLHEVGIPALSVPMGGGKGHKQDWIESDYDLLQRFDTLYLCLDNDAAGREGTTEIVGRLGSSRCRLVELPFKDANEALMQGWNHEAFAAALHIAKTLDPEELKSASHFLAQVLDSFTEDDPHRPPPGIATPWPSVGRNFLFRPGEVTLWGGYSGSGKSAITNHIAAFALTRHSRWCIASMEMPATQTLHRMVLQILSAGPTLDAVRQCVRWLGDKLWMFDVMGTSKIERMLDVFAYAAGRYDIRNFIVDSLAKCGLAEDDWNSQKQFVEQLTDFARHHDSHVHLVAHARKGEGEACQRPTKHDIRGTSAITDMVHNVVTIWRDKDAEQNTGTNRVVLDVCKQRNHTWEHRIELLYDPANFRYLDETGPNGAYPLSDCDLSGGLDKTNKLVNNNDTV